MGWIEIVGNGGERIGRKDEGLGWLEIVGNGWKWVEMDGGERIGRRGDNEKND